MMGAAKKIRLGVVDAIRSFSEDEDGATAIEYSLIVALIFLAVVGAVRSYTETTSGVYGEITDTLLDATN